MRVRRREVSRTAKKASCTGAKRRSCRRCNGPLTAYAVRCPQCGDRYAALKQAAGSSAASECQLSEIQKAILAAAGDGAPIYVYSASGSEEGEVKSGSQRFSGDHTVMAVKNLVAPGLVEQTEEDCFSLTNKGVRLAAELGRATQTALPSVHESVRSPGCSVRTRRLPGHRGCSVQSR